MTIQEFYENLVRRSFKCQKRKAKPIIKTKEQLEIIKINTKAQNDRKIIS